MTDRKKGYKKRPHQLFIGELTDEELGFIEDALNWATEKHKENLFLISQQTAEKIINKLYSVFHEKRKANGRICYEKVT